MRRAAGQYQSLLQAAKQVSSVASTSSRAVDCSVPQALSLSRLLGARHGTVMQQASLASKAFPRPSLEVWRTISGRCARQYQTLHFPARSGFRSPFSAETALQALIAGNAAVFIGWRLDPYFMHKHFTVSLRAVREGRVYTMLTACFSHNDFWHLAVNMLTLYFFWDRWRFPSGRLVLLLYLTGGILGNVAFLTDQYLRSKSAHPWGREAAYRASMPALGASGSVNACVIFNIAANPFSTVLIWGLVPVPAFLLGVLWVWSDVSGALGGGSGAGQPSIGYTAHLGGALTGALTWVAYSRGRLRL